MLRSSMWFETIRRLLYRRCLCYSLFLSTQTPELHAKASVCKHNKISSNANGNGRARMQIQERRSRSQPGPVPDFMVFLSCNMLQPVAMWHTKNSKQGHSCLGCRWVHGCLASPIDGCKSWSVFDSPSAAWIWGPIWTASTASGWSKPPPPPP